MTNPFLKISKLQFVRVIYWLFLTYMVAAFLWWYVTLVKQNDQIANVQYGSIQSGDPALANKVHAIQDFQLRKNKQYIGEGLTILFLFLWGAIYVYRSLVKQIRYSNQQQNFMMAVTHELKTPIAITQLNIETLLKRNLDPEQQRKMLEVSLLETQRLDNLCNNILLASQLDMGQYQTNAQAFDFSFIVNTVVKGFQQRFPDRSFVANLQEAVYIKGESVLIQLLLNNLIDNAIKYSGSASPIQIELEAHNGQVILKVKDEGVGVPVNDKEKIFEKFYRVGAEYTRSTKGTGLGLYLCKRIAMFHHAKLEVSANSPKGSIFTFTYFAD
jgi:two-component system sensor histidine kinase CiaH